MGRNLKIETKKQKKKKRENLFGIFFVKKDQRRSQNTLPNMLKFSLGKLLKRR